MQQHATPCPLHNPAIVIAISETWDISVLNIRRAMAFGGCLLATCLLAFMTIVAAQSNYYADVDYKCPRHWTKFQESCYRFVKSPLKRREEARRTCQAYQSDLLSINTVEEHGFLLHQLQWLDPQHRTWYTGVRQSGGYWSNEADGSQLVNMENALLPEMNDGVIRDYLAYSFSNGLKRWGLEKVTGAEHLLYICEAPISNLHNLAEDDRTYTYGIEIDNPLRIPRGPYFIKQPTNKVFDVSKRGQHNQVSLNCIAGGYPTPVYEWFKEYHEDSRLIEAPIDPLSNPRYTLSGGALIIYNPTQNDDRGAYHCKASNKYGTIISESVELSFGYILEFNLKRSEESGEQNWGKAVYCDPPQHYPGVKYYWARDFFPNFVEEDKRVFSSNDGALYFSALEPIDRGNYSCNVQSVASDTGRNGPFFPLRVDPHPNFQQLKFPNNFPKVFPEAPVVGEEVRLECVAFGYPVPAYNWTRRGSPLPRGAYLTSFNRVLNIPRVHIEDQGEYICRAHNNRLSIDNSVWLTIQAAPNFTIPLEDKHMDNHGELTWMCEAFGVPDVTYNWFKNGRLLDNMTVSPEDIDRYVIQDNVLRIKFLDPERDSGMYQCRARNQLKTSYSSAQLRVLSLKPSFKKHPMESESYAAERGNVTIVCNPEAAPKPKFVWKKDGNMLGSGGRRRILDNGNLIISPVSRDDEGLYICGATNQYGSDETRGRLIVLRGPTFIETLSPRIHTAVMNNQTLRCRAENEAMLDIAYIWTHNGIRIRDKDLRNNPRITIDEGTLEIINMTLAEAGEYECIVESAVGKVYTKTLIIVDGPPGPPGGIQVTNVVKTSVTLQWTDGAFNGRPILFYTISARSRWINNWFNLTENVTAIQIDRNNGRKEVFLEKILNPYTTYEFRVFAANELGYGPPSLPSPKYSTPPDRPSKAPSNIGGGGGKLGDLTITWDPLRPEDQNGRGIHYNVSWRRTNEETEFQSILLKQYGNVGSCVVRTQQEFYYTKYDVMVQAINEVGAGPHSPIAVVHSAEDMPRAAPQKIFAMSYNSTSLNVTWEPLDDNRQNVRGKLIGYRIKYWPDGANEDDATYYLSRTTRPWALIVGLQPDRFYRVKSMAYNSAGAGPESERFIERTYRKPPQMPPSAVDLSVVNPSTVYLSWRYIQPSLDEEPIDGFKVRVWEIDQDMSTANDTIVPGGSKLQAYVYNLTPGKTYNLRVLAFSRGGDGRMSSPITQFQMGDEREFRNGASSRIIDAYLGLSFIIIMWQQGFV